MMRGDTTSLRVERVGVAGVLDEVVVGLPGHLDDFRLERGQGFHFQLVARARYGEARATRCDHLELSHVVLLTLVADSPYSARIVAQDAPPRRASRP